VILVKVTSDMDGKLLKQIGDSSLILDVSTKAPEAEGFPSHLFQTRWEFLEKK
jgi:hypothetical protein